MNGTPDSWEDSADALAGKTEQMSISGPTSATSPTSKFNTKAAAFVPSWMAQPAATPAQPVQTIPAQVPVQPTPAPVPAPAQPAAAVTEKPTPVPVAEPPKPAPTPVEQAASTSSSTSNLRKDKSMDFEIPKDHKEHLNIVFIGHVDAGKSTMGGHILFLTGMVDKRTMEKYEREAKEQGRESWYLSWALDLDDKERAKGKTVECGKAFFETERRRFTILDAPGHKNYVPSMIGGAAQADVGVLVISARQGEFEAGFEKGGQTREHAMLAKTAGVKKLIVVINKMDTCNWDKARYDECTSKLLPFLKQCGYNPKTDIDMMPLSGYTGANIKDRFAPGVCDWYQGPSLLEFLDTMKLPQERNLAGALMIPITDKFKDMGTMVSGKVESGKLRKGQNVVIMPNRKAAQILEIWLEETEMEFAAAGDNVRLRLKNVEEEDVMPGFVICDTRNPVHTVTAFEAQIHLIEYKSIMCAGYTCVMHAHASIEEVTIAQLLHMIDKKTGRKSKAPPKFLRQGDAAIVRLEVSSGQQVCLETYEDLQQLGRFNLRDEGKTIAIGKVTKLILDTSA